MHLDFIKVRYRNFLAVGNNWITIDLDKSHLTAITGLNGSGKTTIAEAIVYALFGRPHRKVNLGGLINIKSKGGLEVEIEWKQGSTLYKVVRGEKPKKFEIWENGELLKQPANIKLYQKMLENRIGFDKKLFTQMVILEKEDFVPFMSLDAASRRKVVEDVLGISIFSFMNKIASAKIKQVKIEYDDIELNIRLLQKDIDNAASLISELEANAARQVSEKQAEAASERARCDEIVERLRLVKEEASPLLTALTAYDGDKMKEKTANFFRFGGEIRTKIKACWDKIGFFESNSVCPTCGQSMNPSHVKSIVDDCNIQIRDLDGKHEELKRREEDHRLAVNSFIDTEEKVREIKQRAMLVSAELDAAKANLSLIEASIKKLESSLDLDPKRETLKELQSKMSELLIRKADVDKVYDALRDVVISLKDDGAKAHVIKQYIPVINQILNGFLEKMNFNIAFQLDETFGESFANPARSGFVYENLSNGQKRRVDFAILLTWKKVAEAKSTLSCNLLFIDEMMESLDPEGVEMLLLLLKQEFSDKNIFVITQRQEEMASHFRSEISFKLENDFTVIK